MPRRSKKGACPPRPRPISGRALEDLPRELFRDAVLPGRCRVCGRRGVVAHHVVYKQELRKRGLLEYDVRDAMPLCDLCHARHHNRSQPIPIQMLTDGHIDFAFEVLGPAALIYLARRYDCSTPDSRLGMKKKEVDAA